MCQKTERRKPYCTALLLAGGSGRRMGANKAKQFLEVGGKPLIWYALQALEQSEIVDDCVLVTSEKDIVYVREVIVEREGFSKVRAVTPGGRERFESVWRGLKTLEEGIKSHAPDAPQVIMIHDGARPCLTEDILERCFWDALKYGACVAAVPSKDTVTLADGEGFEAETPDRKYVWNVQTPQAFRTEIVYPAFCKMARELEERKDTAAFSWITDDASVVRRYAGGRIRIVQGDYRNIKVTTPEDLWIAKEFLGHGKNFCKNMLT